MGNAGKEIENRIIRHFQAGNIINFKTLDNKVSQVEIYSMYHFGQTTLSKVDIVVNKDYRLQIKSVHSNRASIINQTPVRNFQKLAKRELMDISPILKAIEEYSGKTVKLGNIANKEDWREIVNYFLFEGTATKQADSYMQANYLLDVDNNDSYLLIPKKSAFDYIWNSLYLELRKGRSKNDAFTVTVRYGKK